MRSRSHLGTGFEVWNGQQTWFWFVGDPHRNGGAVGAAATETEAVREACSSIEEMSAQRRAGRAGLRVTMAAFRQSNPVTLDVVGWDAALANLERYLTCSGGAGA